MTGRAPGTYGPLEGPGGRRECIQSPAHLLCVLDKLTLWSCLSLADVLTDPTKMDNGPVVDRGSSLDVLSLRGAARHSAQWALPGLQLMHFLPKLLGTYCQCGLPHT
jgi:hypothetical protein